MTTLSYELAKELKDAGFPQKERGTLLFPPATSLTESQEQWNAKSAYAPTLTELIEACGDDLTTLGKVDGEWVAYSQPALAWSGSTPKVAVAHLWLALNKP